MQGVGVAAASVLRAAAAEEFGEGMARVVSGGYVEGGAAGAVGGVGVGAACEEELHDGARAAFVGGEVAEERGAGPSASRCQSGAGKVASHMAPVACHTNRQWSSAPTSTMRCQSSWACTTPGITRNHPMYSVNAPTE